MYEPDDLPPEYEEEEGPDYAIIEEDRINQALDGLSLPNYDDVELRLNQEEMNDKKRKAYLNKILNDAKIKRAKLTGYSTQITKELKKGSISEAEAQMKRKVINDTRKVLTDYMDHNKQKLKNIKGYGLKKKIKRGGQVQFFNNPTEMIKKLELIIGSTVAGNNSIELRNTGVALLDILLRNAVLNKYRKSYERECISGFMSTSDVLKVLKIARAVGDCNLRTLKTSRVTINPEMHEQVHTIFYLLYIQQNYSFALLCTPYVPHQKHFNGFPNTHMFYLNQSKI